MRTNYYLKKICGIYVITHKDTGKQYCGQSIDCFERFKQHTTPKKNSTGIKGAIMKYGVDAFSFQILEECKRELLNEREIYWIAELGTLSPGGYNLNSGGGAPTTRSEETKQRHSKSLIGRKGTRTGVQNSADHREKISAALKGVPRSEDLKLKVSKAMTGKSQSPEHIAKRIESIRSRKAARDAEKLKEVADSCKEFESDV